MSKKRRFGRGIVFVLLAAMLLPMGVYAQTGKENSADIAVSAEVSEDSARTGAYEKSVSSSDAEEAGDDGENTPSDSEEAGDDGENAPSDSEEPGDDEEEVSTGLTDVEASEEELVGAGYEGNNKYLPYENAKYYLRYKIGENNEVTITSCSPNEDSTAEVCGDIVIPDEIEGYPVTKIGNSAFDPSYVGQFYGTLTLPRGLKSIEGNAFRRQNNLTGDLILPEGVTSIGREAFYNCTGFNGKLILSKELTSIGASAFRYCSGFNGSLIFPDGLTEIGEYAFDSCTGFSGDLRLPEGLTDIPFAAFYGCSGFSGTLTLPSSLTRIGYSAFNRCSGLTGDLILPSGLTALGQSAFLGCSGFDGKLVLPDSLTSIGGGAFYNCSGFTGNLVLPKGLGTIEKETFVNCSEIVNVSIPAGITSIQDRAFDGCCGLTNVYYEGSNWGAVTVGANNYRLQNAKIQCNKYYTSAQMPPSSGNNGTPTAVLKPLGSSGPVVTRLPDWQEYTTWSDTVKANLYDNGNGLTRVECDYEKVIVENYDSNLRYQAGWTLDMELPIWGGFYAGEKYNFIVFGQENPNEDDSLEVLRVVKYDKAWNRLGHASLKGANTTLPFRAGSLRFDEYGGMLYIHTCHQMYTSPRDGLRHQSNMTLALREDDTWLTDWRYDVSNISTGYVSHSFNQFVLVDGDGNIVTLDHGDGYPRSAVMVRYGKKAGKNGFTGGNMSSANLIVFPGKIGDNNTNASVGGLAETGSGYIAAYNYSPSGEPYIRNIHIAYMPKDSFSEESVVTWTNPEAKGTTPVIASAGDEGGYVLWRDSIERLGVGYVHYDAQGNISQMQSCGNAQLSDCKPILYKGNLVWYVPDGVNMTFYALNEGGITAYDPTDPNTVLQDPEQIRNFVKRLYTVCLGREYEEDGLRYWFRYLSSHTKTAAEVAQGFFFSDEFQDKGYSDQEYLNILYRTMFDREAGTEELNYWLERFENGMSRLFVYRGFAESVEFSDLCGRFGVIQGSVELTAYRDRNEGATGFVARLYTKMLGRSFDEDGLEYWCRAYLTGEKTIEDIASDGFLHSPELLNMNLSDEEFIARMYRTFLNREPEANGLAYWENKLSTGEENRDTLVYGFTLSPEFAELKAYYGL